MMKTNYKTLSLVLVALLLLGVWALAYAGVAPEACAACCGEDACAACCAEVGCAECCTEEACAACCGEDACAACCAEVGCAECCGEGQDKAGSAGPAVPADGALPWWGGCGAPAGCGSR